MLERGEDGAGVVARAAHVALEPLLERADVVLLLARNVGRRLPCDLPESLRELGPVGPRHDLDPLRRRRLRDLGRREVEDEPGVPADLVVPVARRPGEAALVVLRDGTFELRAVVLGRPALERVEDRDADAGAALVRRDECGSDRAIGRRVPADERVAGADRVVVALGEQPDHVARLVAPVDEAGDGGVLPRLGFEGDGDQFLQFVLGDLANSQHPATLVGNTHTGATWFRRGRYAGRAASRGPRSAS